jgi:hypothetical protein
MKFSMRIVVVLKLLVLRWKSSLTDVNRIQIYNASYTWEAKDFELRGFYRTGHYHWG